MKNLKKNKQKEPYFSKKFACGGHFDSSVLLCYIAVQ